jgi:predicted dithiol-disulfide oxidoreductase (DUF899 family)
MSLPEIVSREQWLSARRALLEDEKRLTAARDELSAQRRRLPMVEIDKPYRFEGPDGPATLLDLFEGRRQLIVDHFMFDPDWEDGCASCTGRVEQYGNLEYLHARETTMAVVSRASLEKIERFRARKGWTFPWYSSFGSDFNYDFHVTMDESVAPLQYNFRDKAEMQATGQLPPDISGSQELPGRSYFLRVDDRVFHTYSVFARGMESVGGSYYFLDETALGRQEDWEEPKGRVESAHSATPDFSVDDEVAK